MQSLLNQRRKINETQLYTLRCPGFEPDGRRVRPAVKADEWNKKTDITINQPIKVQDTVLPAGSYVIKLLDSPSDRYIVQIFNAEENHLITTVFAVPVLKSHAPDSSEFKFYESESGQPAALHTWFYPGESTGYEFRAGREGVAPAPSIADAMPSTKVGS